MQTPNNAERGPSVPSSAPGSNVRTPSYLGSNLQIKGEITGDEDLRLDCKMEGLVCIGGFRLTVGPRAHLEGEIVAREAIISGEVNGDVRAWDRIEIKKDASVVGDISTGRIKIEEGAYFNGTLAIDSQGQQIGTDLNSLLSGAKMAKEK
jgi:cytoskeletal protein CcmA (bactofilin family)